MKRHPRTPPFSYTIEVLAYTNDVDSLVCSGRLPLQLPSDGGVSCLGAARSVGQCSRACGWVRVCALSALW
ncbi:hypothetical protein V9T40_011183 [Parthenolecanium corni]|uniref:Uncharacterized protein n=1 Tax=Parthenolecanium corni TaxID=536013 RepID=A0AAN9T4X4_9HEMI